MPNKYTIDAKNRSFGRVASEAALKLRGKQNSTYTPNILSTEKVEIINASKIKLTDHKKINKTYHRHSGYPGGIKYENLEEVITKHGYPELFIRAIKGMIPNNRLRSKIMKNLSIVN